MAAWRKLEGRQVDEAIGEGLVMLDFFQDACAPCHVLEPRLEAFACKHRGELTIHAGGQGPDERAWLENHLAGQCPPARSSSCAFKPRLATHDFAAQSVFRDIHLPVGGATPLEPPTSESRPAAWSRRLRFQLHQVSADDRNVC